MKKVVFGKIVYDTDKAALVYNPGQEINALSPVDLKDLFGKSNMNLLHDINPDYESLYRTPEGRFFTFGGGGMMAESLVPLSAEKAAEWVLNESSLVKQLVRRKSSKKDLLNKAIEMNLEALRNDFPMIAPFLK